MKDNVSLKRLSPLPLGTPTSQLSQKRDFQNVPVGSRTIKEKRDTPKLKDARLDDSGERSSPKMAESESGNLAEPTTRIRPKGTIRFRPPPYIASDFNAIPRLPTFNPVLELGEFRYTLGTCSDYPLNRRGYRYTPCSAAPHMPAIMYCSIELPPYKSRLDWQDMDTRVMIDRDGYCVTNERGFRMVRANVAAREGDWYTEFSIIQGGAIDGSQGHIRLGVARREAPLDAPVGFDAYSYGLRDITGEKIHLSRPMPFMGEPFATGDVIGIHIHLPEDIARYPQWIRERIPIRYKGQLYFEQWEYSPTPDTEVLMHSASTIPEYTSVDKKQAARVKPATIAGSFIDVYKNGKLMGRPFIDLLAFLPPHSRISQANNSDDDGTLGYYPAVSVYGKGIASVNCGPIFKFSPPTGVRPMSERYEEQIVEDIMRDLVDEIDWMQDLVGAEWPLDYGKGSEHNRLPSPDIALSEIKEIDPEDEI